MGFVDENFGDMEMKKRYALFLVMLFAVAVVPIQPSYRLATTVRDLMSYTTINNATVISGRIGSSPVQFDDGWSLWEERDLFVSSQDYLVGEKLQRISSAEGYYCTADMVVVPNTYASHIVYTPPVTLAKRTQNYTFGVNRFTSGNLTFVFQNNDVDTSFGWYGALFSINRWATGPLLVLSYALESVAPIEFINYDASYHDMNRDYYVYEFPVVQNDVDFSGDGMEIFYVGYTISSEVNLSVAILDGYSYEVAALQMNGFPTPSQPTVSLNITNIKQLHEPLVWFMPQIYPYVDSNWHTPDDNDTQPVPPPDIRFGENQVIFTCCVFIGIFLVPYALTEYYYIRKGKGK